MKAELDYIVRYGKPLPQERHIITVQSFLDGRVYKCKVLRIKGHEWTKKWFRRYLKLKLIVKIVD